jgi:hypothetical protein
LAQRTESGRFPPPFVDILTGDRLSVSGHSACPVVVVPAEFASFVAGRERGQICLGSLYLVDCPFSIPKNQPECIRCFVI